MPEAVTAAEVAAIRRRLPLPMFRRLLDICCGPARHARPLAIAGYQVTGVDRDRAAIEEASRTVPNAAFHVADQRDLSVLAGPFDAAVMLWQSFGYFDPDTNDRVLGGIAALLRPKGRLLLDVYHPGFARAHVGTTTPSRTRDCRSIHNAVEGGRLTSTIVYADGSTERMDFELFEPENLARRASTRGFTVIEACSSWDASRSPTPDEQRYQLVLERRE